MRSAPARMNFSVAVKVAAELDWVEGTGLEVQIGEGEHHGLLRVRALFQDVIGAAVTVKHRVAGNGKRCGPYFSFSLGHVAQFVNRSEPRKWVQWERLEDGWLEIVLPRWADETGPAGARARVAPPIPVAVAKPSGQQLTGGLMGDPPKGRSALDLRAASASEPSRSALRRQAEERERAEHEQAEAAEAARLASRLDAAALLQRRFGLTPSEAAMVAALADGRVKSREVLLAAYGVDVADDDAADPKTVDVFMVKIRKKLMVAGVGIDTVRGAGFQMPAAGVRRLSEMLEAA
jgi:hypothetical protein